MEYYAQGRLLFYILLTVHLYIILYRGADKSIARPTSLSNVFFQSREQVVVGRGEIRRMGWVIKTLEAQVGHFLLGCKCPVSRFLPGRAKDLSDPCKRNQLGARFILNVFSQFYS
jgi:hypothetical protein